MDPMAYLKDLAKRNPRMQLSKALEKLIVAEKAAQLRAEATSRSSPREKTRDHHRPDDKKAGWLVDWENAKQDSEAIADIQGVGSVDVNLAGRILFDRTPGDAYGFVAASPMTFDTRRLTPGNCKPCVWGSAPEFYGWNGPSENHVVQCMNCGMRPSGVVAEPITYKDPDDRRSLEKRAEFLGIRFFSTPTMTELEAAVTAQERIRQSPADADTERLDVYGI